jgi:hypothetical protein
MLLCSATVVRVTKHENYFVEQSGHNVPLSKANQGTTANYFTNGFQEKRKSSVGGENKTSAIARIRGNAIERGIPRQCVHPAVTLHTQTAIPIAQNV